MIQCDMRDSTRLYEISNCLDCVRSRGKTVCKFECLCWNWRTHGMGITPLMNCWKDWILPYLLISRLLSTEQMKPCGTFPFSFTWLTASCMRIECWFKIYLFPSFFQSIFPSVCPPHKRSITWVQADLCDLSQCTFLQTKLEIVYISDFNMLFQN